MGPYPTMAIMAEKHKLRDEINELLAKVDREDCMMGAFIKIALKNQWNFDHYIMILSSSIEECPEGAQKLLGYKTIELITQYLKK